MNSDTHPKAPEHTLRERLIEEMIASLIGKLRAHEVPDDRIDTMISDVRTALTTLEAAAREEGARRAEIRYDAAVYDVYGSEGAIKVRKALTPNDYPANN